MEWIHKENHGRYGVSKLMKNILEKSKNQVKQLMLTIYKSYSFLFTIWALITAFKFILKMYSCCLNEYTDIVTDLYIFLLTLFAVHACCIFAFVILWREDNIINHQPSVGVFGSSEVRPLVLPLYFIMCLSISKIVLGFAKLSYTYAEYVLWLVLVIISGSYWLKLQSKASIKWSLTGTLFIVLYTIFILFYKELEPILKAILDISGCIANEIKQSGLPVKELL